MRALHAHVRTHDTEGHGGGHLGHQGLLQAVRTAAEEDNLAVVWLEGATADRAREAAAAVGAKAMGLAWNGAQRYGVRTLPEDREEVESALNGGNFHARVTHPLWVVSGLPPGMNWLDLEGTLHVVAGWKARAVRKLGGTGRSRLTWLVEARDPPPRLSFMVPGGMATVAQGAAPATAWRTDPGWGMRASPPVQAPVAPGAERDDEMKDDEALQEAPVSLVGQLRARKEAEERKLKARDLEERAARERDLRDEIARRDAELAQLRSRPPPPPPAETEPAWAAAIRQGMTLTADMAETRAWHAEQEKLVAKLREGARTDTKRDRDTDMVDAESDRVRRRTERREEPTATQMGAIQMKQAQMRHQMSEMANAVSAIKGELMAVLEHLRTTMQPSQ